MNVTIRFLYFLVFIISAASVLSCQKELDFSGSGIINPADQKPKVGTTWTYRYYTFYLNGQLGTIKMLTYRAKNEVAIGGEQWLNVVDIDTDTTVYLLKEKVDGLYLNANGNPYLFCKAPAAVNDTYNVLYESWNQDFVVKLVNDTLPTGVGDVPVNYYEGYLGTHVVGKVWYHKNAWIVRKHHYRKFAIGPAYYRFSELYINDIVY